MMNYQLLIVDDNPMMRTFLTSYLGKRYDVVALSSAEEALDWLFDKNYPDMIIADYDLEGMDGYQLVERIRLSSVTREIPMIIISGKSSSENRIRCLTAGADDYISKPFNPIELEIKVNKFISTKPPRARKLQA
jgi:DNA-binding response OmpR family regulator